MLQNERDRNKEGKFVAEGFKVVDDLLALQPADLIVATQEWLHGKHLADQNRGDRGDRGGAEEGKLPAASAAGAGCFQTGNIRRLLLLIPAN